MAEFDQIGSPTIVYPISHYPTAQMVGMALAGALRNSVFATRHKGQLVMQQSFGFQGNNFTIAATDVGFATTAYVDICKADAYVPSLTTHLVAAVVFSVSAGIEATAYHRLTATDSDVPTSVSVVQSQVVPFEENERFLGSIPGGDFFRERTRPYVQRLDLDITSLTADADWLVGLEAYAAVSPTEEAYYSPHHVSVWWEAQD